MCSSCRISFTSSKYFSKKVVNLSIVLSIPDSLMAFILSSCLSMCLADLSVSMCAILSVCVCVCLVCAVFVFVFVLGLNMPQWLLALNLDFHVFICFARFFPFLLLFFVASFVVFPFHSPSSCDVFPLHFTLLLCPILVFPVSPPSVSFI